MNNIERLKPISLANISIQDRFWNRYIKLVKEVIIPYQWNTLNDLEPEAEPSYCIHNFKIAAGEMTGTFGGAVFQDTDVAKWIEAVAYTLAKERDEELELLVDQTIDLIAKAQCKDGYINTYFTIKEPSLRWTNLEEGHELYTAGHLIEAAVAYYEATGKDKFLQMVSRFADLICEKFGSGEEQCHGYPGHQEIELALVKLYRITQKKSYLELAKYFIDQRGVGNNYFLEEEKSESFKRIFQEFANYDTKYSQSHLPVREQHTAEGHAVRAVYMYCAMADIAYEYQEKELLQICNTLWDNITRKRMYITGGIGSSGMLERFTTDYDLPNDSNYSETCASIGLALFGKRMADITRDAKYIDVVERALYNTVLAGIALDGKSFFYVNPLEVWPDNCLDRTSKEHVKAIRQKWFGVACCPPNIARTLASLGQYIYSADEETIYFNLYITNEMKWNGKQGQIKFHVKSDAPGDGNVSISLSGNVEERVQLALRIPEYGKEFQIFKNGVEVEHFEILKNYAMIKDAKAGDAYTIRYQAKATFVRANPLVHADVGRVAIVKGPIVYCLEEVDNGKHLAGIYVDTKEELIEQYEEEVLGGTTMILCRGKKVITKEWEEEPLYLERSMELEDIRIKAVPYCSWGNRKPGEMLVWIKETI